ncbi:MAG TPA: hypothetical protein VKP69_30695, partial [Isosphaeraceae bacterium]|nr:hypothetical protein [Isosphaeraceae bacterium]
APSWEPIAQAIFGDAHERITPPEDLRGGPVPRGTRLIHGKFIPVALEAIREARTIRRNLMPLGRLQERPGESPEALLYQLFPAIPTGLPG